MATVIFTGPRCEYCSRQAVNYCMDCNTAWCQEDTPEGFDAVFELDGGGNSGFCPSCQWYRELSELADHEPIREPEPQMTCICLWKPHSQCPRHGHLACRGLDFDGRPPRSSRDARHRTALWW
jgi:hypothetical protein